LFTITYLVVGVTPTTPITFLNIIVADAFGTILPENGQGANVVQNVGPPHPTVSTISCSSPIVGQPITCVVTVTDTKATNPIPPNGIVTIISDGLGAFFPSSCHLSRISASSSQCSVLYLPLAVGTGITHIGCFYHGDPVHLGSTCSPFNLIVSPASVVISTQVIVDQNGLPVNSTIGVPQGLSVHDIVIMNLGYPVTGVTGHVTYTLYPNGLCTALTGTVVATVTVAPADNVPSSPSVAPAAGSWSFDATYYPDTTNNNRITSACEPFTVTPSPSFTAGKLHWTHHLSLSKSGNTQSWTAIVTNPLSASVKLVVRIVGVSTINPSLTFDITCGVTCVTTATGGVSLTPGLTPVTVAAGTSSTSFGFNQLIPGGFVNQKFAFTATVYWATGTLYTSSNSKSGAFAVVP
jgi:hypothetical protein